MDLKICGFDPSSTAGETHNLCNTHTHTHTHTHTYHGHILESGEGT